MAEEKLESEQHDHPDSIELPKPTPWPVTLALGITLAVMGLVTAPAISYLGFVLIIAGCIGWFYDMFPHQRHEYVPIKHEVIEVRTARRSVEVVRPRGGLTQWAPIQFHPIDYGLEAGILGGIAMAIVAILYGLFHFHSIWYVPNLVGGAGLVGWTHPTMAQITHFRATAFVFSILIDGCVSFFVGILYAALLPTLPRGAIVLGGIVAPLIWSILLFWGMAAINPYLAARTNWLWFALSQVAYGLAASWSVSRRTKYPGGVRPSLGVRFGVHSPGFGGRGGGQEVNGK